ncbi:MAG: ExbD/TolR family protein [Burkholderiaceae bacterium]|nr:ExbD/TolR family protein [Burkholderiaceae bacterium]
MAAVVSRRTGARRRTIAEINMVPFIDVMLVLLIIFMVSAPLMTPGVIDLPSVGQARRAPERIIEVQLEADEMLRLKVSAASGAAAPPVGASVDTRGERVALRQLAARVRALQEGSTAVPVVIAADRGVQYEAVVKVMDTLQRAGVARVGLAVRTTGS